MDERYDVVVIGSGFGGAVAACRLSQAGRSVCVLERGRRWRKEEFPRTTGEAARAFWDPAKSYGFMEYRAFQRIDVIQGSGVGGGSLHYFNVQLEPPAEVFENPAWPKSLKIGSLSPYYGVVREMLDAVPLEPPAGRMLPARTEAFFEASRRAGGAPRLASIAVYTGSDRTNPHGGVPQSACVYCGDCMLGCHVHAKNTLDLNYLPLAERQGARIFALHQANRIVPEQDGGYRVHYHRFDEQRPGHFSRGSVFGKQVIVSAGTLGSTELLLQCRDLHKTLPRLGAALGSRFSGNGDFLLSGTLDANVVVDPARGPGITAFADFSTPSHRIIIEDLGYPDPMFWLLEGTLPSESRAFRLLKLAKTYLLRGLGLGVRSSRVSDGVATLLEGGKTTRLLPYLAMGDDAADGRLLLRGGALDIAWSHRASRGLFDEVEQAMRKLSRGLGGRYVRSVLWRWPLRKLLTAHPLGGCVLGDSASESVVNPRNEVWGYPGLFVIDGSVIPTALCVNPSMTIAALAERAAFQMLHEREMEPDDAKRPQNT